MSPPCFILGVIYLYRKAFRKALNLGGAFDTLKYRREFRREHPFYFNPCGTLIFSGPQGSGKTLSAVDYVTRIMEEYPHAILCTNTEFADYPFNAVVSPEPNGEMSVRDYFSHELITHEWICDRLAENSSYRVCVEYSGLDCLKWVNNGEYGVIFFIDEFHLELNSLESKNIDIDVMVEISQQRKQRKHIVGTSQVFMRLAKPLREQIKDIVDCHSLLNLFQWNYIIDGEKSTEKDGQLEPVIVGRSFFFHSPEMYRRYDTYAKMKRYNKEWQGRGGVSEIVFFLGGGPANGLNRYDGYSFKVYQPKEKDIHSLLSNDIWNLQEDGLGNLWIGSEARYCIYDRDKDNFITDIPSYLLKIGIQINGTYKVHVDKRHNLWVLQGQNV